MNLWKLFIVVPTMSHAWRLPWTCSSSSSSSMNLRLELDMLSRFTGQDQWDSYTKNWLRRRATFKTFSLIPSETVRDVRLLEDGQTLTVLSDKHRLHIDLDVGTIDIRQHLQKDTRYILSPNNSRQMYTILYDRDIGHHVISLNNTPLFVTQHYPYVVTDDNNTIAISLSSQEIIIGTTEERFRDVRKISTGDVALASIALDGRIYNGMLKGDLCIYNEKNGLLSVHVFHDPNQDTTSSSSSSSSSIRCLDVESLGNNSSYVFLGLQNGVVKACRYDVLQDLPPEISQCSIRKLHRFPVSRIRFHAGRIASCDEDGRVIVTDMHMVKTMYDMSFESHDDTCIDLNERYLVVGSGNKIHVWDHEDTGVYNSMKSDRRNDGRCGGGGRGGGIKVH